MRHTISFKLPDEEVELNHALNASKYASIINEFAMYLRGELKYNSDNLSDENYQLLESVKKKFYEIIDENTPKLDI